MGGDGDPAGSPGHSIDDMPGGRDASVVVLKGRLGGGTAEGVGKALADGDAGRRAVVVVDLADVSMLASMAIRELLRLSHRVRARGARVVLSGLADAPLRSIEVAGLLDSFETAPDVDSALGAPEA